MEDIAEKAKEYISELQKLLDLNFENPNEELKLFAQNNKMDLNDPKIKKHFLEVRKKYLENINKFYEKNFLGFNKSGANNSNIKNNNKKKILKKTQNENGNINKNIISKKETITRVNTNTNINTNTNTNTNKNKIDDDYAKREFLIKKKNSNTFLNFEWYNIKEYLFPNIIVGILFLVMIYIFIKY
jgi:hypothetical protein